MLVKGHVFTTWEDLQALTGMTEEELCRNFEGTEPKDIFWGVVTEVKEAPEGESNPVDFISEQAALSTNYYFSVYDVVYKGQRIILTVSRLI